MVHATIMQTNYIIWKGTKKCGHSLGPRQFNNDAWNGWFRGIAKVRLRNRGMSTWHDYNRYNERLALQCRIVNCRGEERGYTSL